MTDTLIYGFACEDCGVGWTSCDPTKNRCWRCGKRALPRPGYVIVDLDDERPTTAAPPERS